MTPVEPKIVESGRILTPASGYLSAYTHTLNPYMCCAFGEGGCGVYCYVAESSIGLFAGRPWGTWVSAKGNAADLLRRELAAAPDRSAVRIFMSSATDPYQPAEAQLRVTRSVLGVLAEAPPGLVVIQTRSPLVERDFDVIEQMPFAWLSMTVETDDDDVRRKLTPTCPSIARRLRTMSLARERGIRVQAAVSPMLPADVDRFADLLVESADRVVVDTFAGDGAGGKRTARRPLPAIFREHGLGDWQDQGPARQLYQALAGRLPPGQVGWSVAGFNALAGKPELAPPVGLEPTTF